MVSENNYEMSANENIDQINNQYHKELLKNQEAESIIDNTSQDEENSFTKDAIEEKKSENDLSEFGVDNDAPDLFSSESEASYSEELLSSENENQDDDLEIPAFLRRQKN